MRKSLLNMRCWLPAVALFSLLAGVYLFQLDASHPWYDDAFQYLAHARNLLTGHAYASTGYIYNPRAPQVGPQAYPPVYPLALAAVYKFFGFNLKVFKIENIIFLLAALALAYSIFRRKIGVGAALAVIAITAFNPWFLSFRNCIYADWLCMCLIFAALKCAQDGIGGPGRGAFLGVLCYLAYGTRMADIALPIALIAHDIYTAKKLRPGAAWLAGVFSVMALSQYLLLSNIQDAYIGNMGSSAGQTGWKVTLTALIKPGWAFLDFFSYAIEWRGPEGIAATALCVCAVTLMILYYRRAIKNGNLAPWDFFLPAYALTFFVAYDWQRNFFLIAPIFIYQAAAELADIKTANPIRAKSLLAIIAALIVFNYGTALDRLYRSDYPDAADVAGQESSAMFETIKKLTPEDAIIVCSKPRAMAFFTGRRSVSYAVNDAQSGGLDYFRALNARYFILLKLVPSDRAVLGSLAMSNSSLFTKIYADDNFRILYADYSLAH